jgi:hypothetical protein
MAYLLGFSSVERFEVWERSLARDHFAIFVRDCRPRYPAFAVDIRRFEDFVDLRRSVEERVKIMWEHSSRFAMPPDKSKCEFFPFLLSPLLPPSLNVPTATGPTPGWLQHLHMR